VSGSQVVVTSNPAQRGPVTESPPSPGQLFIWLVFSLFVGFLFGWTLFFATSGIDLYTISGPVCIDRKLERPGFDPWTGQPHGVIVTCPFEPGWETSVGSLPLDLVGRQAIPVPVGVPIGTILAFGTCFLAKPAFLKPSENTERIRVH
jgi:hypothetical protein